MQAELCLGMPWFLVAVLDTVWTYLKWGVILMAE